MENNDKLITNAPKTDSNFKINTNIEAISYLMIVEYLANGFFNSETGEYQPHIGKINAMTLFYNVCVVESKFDETLGHEVTDLDLMTEVIEDKEFISAFNNSLVFHGVIRCDFANAYKDALNIVDNKRKSSGSLLNILQPLLSQFVAKFDSDKIDETLQEVSKAANNLLESDLLAKNNVKSDDKKVNKNTNKNMN